MKLELRKVLPKAVLFFAITTFILAVFSLFMLENQLLRILTQASASLLMLLWGIHTILYQKEKYKMGYLYIGVAAFILLFSLIRALFNT